MAKEKNLILVGVISAAHGIKGDVLVKSYTDPVSNVVKLQLIDKNNNPIKLKMLRVNSKGCVICRLTNCNNRNHAEELKGMELYCYKENLPTLLAEEFYFEDLVIHCHPYSSLLRSEAFWESAILINFP